MTGPNNAAQLARLRFIDMVLDYYGTLNRVVIEDFYGISTPQASYDISHYQQAAPANMEYDSSAKCYRRSATFTRKFP
jgi:hypothetical protein